MKLYHFTARHHLPAIRAAGVLKVTESNMSKRREHAGPDVVWLTSNPEPAAHTWKVGSIVDKTEVRITVEVPKRAAHRWREWARRRGIDREWMRVLASVGGSGSWYVVERPIPEAEWVAVEVLAESADPSVSNPLADRPLPTS